MDWEGLWSAGLAPGEKFDMCAPNKMLEKFLDDGRVPTGRALVPGCGRGYDLAALASPDRFAIGVEYSETAAKAARTYLSENHPGKVAQLRVDHGDFFTYSSPEAFDFIYDYTFFCAIPPSRRNEWAAQMKKLLKPSGILMTLEFPLNPYPPGRAKEHFDEGPPYQLSHKHYEDVLYPEGFELIEHAAIDPSLSDPMRAGSEAYALWKLK